MRVKNDKEDIKFQLNNLAYAIKFLYYHKQRYYLADLRRTFRHYAETQSIIFVLLNLFTGLAIFISSSREKHVLESWSVIKKIHFLNNYIYISLNLNLNWMHKKLFVDLLIIVYLFLWLLWFDLLHIQALGILAGNCVAIMIVYFFIWIFVCDKTAYE